MSEASAVAVKQARGGERVGDKATEARGGERVRPCRSFKRV